MNLQLFYFSNTIANESLRQPNTFLKNITPVTKANSSTIVLAIKAPKRETLPNELHLLKTQKQIRDHFWCPMLKYCNCSQANWVDVFYIKKINIHKYTMGLVIKKFQV